MRKHRIITLLLILLLMSLPVFASAPDLVAESAILMVADTGEILYSKNSDAKMYPASTTKILTAIIAIEDLKLTDEVVGDHEVAFTEGSRIYINEGEVLTVEQLLYALLLDSANDAAIALAKKHSGTIEAFAEVMNSRANAMGATNSHFMNPNGLHNDEHYVTARDMATIAAYAMKNETFRNFVKTVKYDLQPTNKQPEVRHLFNSNRFLYGVGSGNRIDYKGQAIDIKYDIVDGVKTGYTSKAQNCLVSSAVKDGQRLISVVLKSSGNATYSDSRQLLDYGFEAFTKYKILTKGDVVENIKIPGAAEQKGLNLLAETDVYKFMRIGEDSIPVETKVELIDPLPMPITAGQILGKVVFTLNGEIVGGTQLIAEHAVDPAGMLSNLTSAITDEMKKAAKLNWWLTFGLKVGGILLLWRILAVLLRPKRKRKPKVSAKEYAALEAVTPTKDNVRKFRQR